MSTHFSILAWRILWTEEPGRLQSVGLQRVGHDRRDLACMHICNKYKNNFKNFVYFYILNLRNLVCTLHLYHVLIQSSHISMFNSYTWIMDTTLDRAAMRNMAFILNLSFCISWISNLKG